MSSYKYYYNSGASSPVTRQFFSFFYREFNPFYIGNLIWMILFILSVIVIFKIYTHAQKVNSASLKWMFIFSILTIVLLLIALMMPAFKFVDEQTSRMIELNVKGTRTISLVLFTSIYLLMTLSLCTIGFSALKRVYFLRAFWLSLLTCIIVIISVFLTISFHSDDKSEIVNSSVKLDAGVILGAAVWGGNRPSPVLRERINKGYELFKNKKIGQLVLTGGGSPGELTEAEVEMNELIKKGVDEKFIMIENKSNSTLEQITYIKRNLYERNRWTSIVLISDNFHLFRTKQICSFFGMKSYTISSDTPLSAESGFNFMLKESFAVILFWLFGIG